MEFYNIETRIYDLYIAISLHIESYSAEPRSNKRDIEKSAILSYGFKEINEEEKRKAFVQFFKPTIHHLANFKDNLKNLFKEKELNEQIIEEVINNSKELQIIIDLANQFKHSYPLKYSNRSNLSPKITNIKYSWDLKFPLGNIFHNPLQDDMILDADIVKGNNELITSFTYLVKKATENWEEIIIKYLPDKAKRIIRKRKEKELLEKKRKKFQHLINEAKKILDNNKWIEVPYSYLRKEMIVVGAEMSGKYHDTNRGVINKIQLENSILYAYILTDYPTFIMSKNNLIKTKWKVLKIVNPNDLIILLHYYYSFTNKYNEVIKLQNKYTSKHFI